MSRFDDRARVSLSADPSATGTAAEVDDPPFCIIVLGDFSAGGGSAGRARPLGERRPIPVDSLDGLLDRVCPVLEIDVNGSGSVPLEITTLEDLHPDALIERLPHLEALVEGIEPAVRRGLAPAEGTSAGRAGEEARGSAPAAPPRPAPEGLLDEIVDAASDDPPGGRRAGAPMDELERWVEEAVAPHRVRTDTEAEADARGRLEREAAERVREVLHAPHVRALEALLRGVLFLVASLQDRTKVRVLALDVSRSELEADLAGGELQASGLLRALVEPLPGPCGASPPALLVGAWEFGDDTRSLALLNRIAMVAHLVGSPWLSAAGADLLGLESFDVDADRTEPREPGTLWDAFRATPAAGSIGLVAPPFLLRLPYGSDTDPCERLPVEEAASGGLERYLWGNPAFVAAAAIADEFHARGWSLQGHAGASFGSRPLHATDEGEPRARPTRGVWSGATVEDVRRRGVTPLVAHRHEARMQLPSVASIAVPPSPLVAWWSQG